MVKRKNSPPLPPKPPTARVQAMQQNAARKAAEDARKAAAGAGAARGGRGGARGRGQGRGGGRGGAAAPSAASAPAPAPTGGVIGGRVKKGAGRGRKGRAAAASPPSSPSSASAPSRPPSPSIVISPFSGSSSGSFSPSTTAESDDSKSAKLDRAIGALPRRTKPSLRLNTSLPGRLPPGRLPPSPSPILDPSNPIVPDPDKVREARLRAAAVKKRRRIIDRWRRKMKYPRKYLDQWHGQTAPEKAVKPFLQIRKEMGRTVPGFEGLPDSVECYNIPSGFTPGSAIPSEDMKGEEKWVHPLPRSKRDDLYMDPKCVDWLAQWGCYLADVSPSDYASPTASPNVRGDGTGPMQEDQNICDQLLTDKLDSPTGTLFDDASWNAVRNAARGHNAPGIMNLVGNLIVPSAEFAGFREPEVTVKHLKDAVCHYWDWACPFDENSERLPHRYAVNLPAMGYKPPIPQPDYTAGFHQDAFGPGRKDAMDDAARYFESPLPFEPAARCKMSGHSFTCVIRKLVFPFLTAETKQAPSNEEKATLETAERQNAHSMAVAMRNIIAICKRSFPKRVRKLHRRILGFSISYDHKSVRIHAHYPRIKFNPNDDEIMKITYHSWVVKEEFQWITDKDKWTAYKFVMNVYKTWVPDHQHRLREMLKGLQAWNLIHNNLIDEARINVNGDGLSTPAVQDPDVPDVDFKLLKRLRKDHRRALRQAGRSRTPAGSDVPSVGDKVQLIEVRKGQPRHHST